jgi:hypothetical protein
VTLVTGLPRSGTSMMMRMLEAGGLSALVDSAREADADNPRGYYEYAPVKRTRECADWVASAGGMVVKIVYRLLEHLPPGHAYRVLFMRRHLPEVFASQQKMLERLGQDADAMDEAGFARIFAAELDRTARWLRDQPDFKTLDVDYNALVQDPGPAIVEIDRFLGGGLDTEAMRALVEPALYRQRARGA